MKFGVRIYIWAGKFDLQMNRPANSFNDAFCPRKYGLFDQINGISLNTIAKQTLKSIIIPFMRPILI